MSIKFTWDDKYSVKNSEIDEQHQFLFNLGNQLPDANDETEIKPIIMKLFKYTRKHFGTEEKMMMEVDFPELKKHQKLHEDIIEQLAQISTHDFKTRKDILDFKIFFYDWLMNHILKEDMKYCQFINSDE